MSKKRTRRGITTPSFTPTATRSRVPQVHRFPTVTFTTNKFALSLIEDRRRHYPGPSPFKRPIQQFTVGRAARLHIIQDHRYSAPSQTKGRIAFKEPHKLPICIRRQQRKQVLHAKGVAGGKVGKPHRNEWSDVSCR